MSFLSFREAFPNQAVNVFLNRSSFPRTNNIIYKTCIGLDLVKYYGSILVLVVNFTCTEHCSISTVHITKGS